MKKISLLLCAIVLSTPALARDSGVTVQSDVNFGQCNGDFECSRQLFESAVENLRSLIQSQCEQRGFSSSHMRSVNRKTIAAGVARVTAKGNCR